MKNKTGNYRWQVVILLFFATTINYIDRQVIGMLKPFIAEDLGWSEAGYGYIVAAFQVAYAIGLLLSGRLLDKIGVRLGYTIAITVWSIAGMAHAAARSAFSFGVARFSLGLGESANFPAAIKTVAEWFPKKERALATGLFNSGSNVGAIAAPLIVTGITVSMGWQWAFVITGFLGFIWIVFWLLFYHPPQNHPRLSEREYRHILSDNEDEKAGTMAWREVIGYRQTIAVCIARFTTDWVWWFFLFWSPAFLNQTFGVDIKEMVLPLIIIYSFAGAGGIAGGWLSSHFIKSGESIDYSRKNTILICAIIALSIIATPLLSNIWVVVGIISLGTVAHTAFASNIFTVVSDIFPKKAVGTVTGLSGFAGSVGGVLAASFVGLVLEYTNSYFLIFIIAGTMYMLAWAALKILVPTIKPVNLNNQ